MSKRKRIPDTPEKIARVHAHIKRAREAPEVGAALYQVWASGLPRRAKRILKASEIQAWRDVVQATFDNKEAARALHEERQLEADEQTYFREAARSRPSLAIHGNTARRLLRALRPLAGRLTFTICIERVGEAALYLPPEMATLVTNDRGEFGSNNRDVIIAQAVLSEALQNGGNVVVRQTLAIQSMRVNHKGEETWVNQKKVFTAQLLGGQIIPNTAEKTRWSYETDSETGKPLPPEPGIQYGDMAEMLRQEAMPEGATTQTDLPKVVQLKLR